MLMSTTLGQADSFRGWSHVSTWTLHLTDCHELRGEVFAHMQSRPLLPHTGWEV